MLYYSLIYLCLLYDDRVWANNYPTRLAKVLDLQKKVLKIITFSSYNAPSLTLFKKLGILNMHQINDLLIGLFSFSLDINALPAYFDSRKLHKTFNRTNYGIYSTRNKTIYICNSIPLSIKESRRILSLIKRCSNFYCPTEFEIF